MEATKMAHDENGDLSLCMVDGRCFVHGSILDDECNKRNVEIERLRAILAAVDHTLSIHGHIDADTELHERVQDALKE